MGFPTTCQLVKDFFQINSNRVASEGLAIKNEWADDNCWWGGGNWKPY